MAEFQNPMCCILTGAGKGLGRALCVALATELTADSHMVLLGRNPEQLSNTQSLVAKVNDGISFSIYSKFDCSNLEVNDVADFMSSCCKQTSNIQSLLIIHNAGTCGEPSQLASEITYEETTAYMTLNMSAMVSLNNITLKAFDRMPNKTVVQISSLAALVPLKSLSLYCAGKAARDMFFQVLAAEHPTYRVLNYAPGPLATDMFEKIKTTTCDKDTESTFNGLTPLEPAATSARLITILKENRYKSGQHLDYYDELPQ